MRCGSYTLLYAFADGTTSARSSFPVVLVGAEGASCAESDYVVLTAAELTQYTSSPFRLSLSEAGAISSAVLLIWALGFGIRMALKSLKSDQSESEDF